MVLYSSQVYSTVVSRVLYKVVSPVCPPSARHHTVTTISLTLFPVLCVTAGLFCNHQLCSVPSPGHPAPTLPFGNDQGQGHPPPAPLPVRRAVFFDLINKLPQRLIPATCYRTFPGLPRSSPRPRAHSPMRSATFWSASISTHSPSG